MVAFEVLLSDLMGIKTFPVISWLVLDQSVDKALSVRMSLLLNLYLEFEVIVHEKKYFKLSYKPFGAELEAF
jgi:hypothetical protein